MEGWFRIITLAAVLQLPFVAPFPVVSEMHMAVAAPSSTPAETIGATSDVTAIDVTVADTSVATTELTSRSSSSPKVSMQSSSTPVTSSVPTSNPSPSPASSIPWKGMTFGFAGSTFLFIIATVVALVVLCRFKRRLGNASRTLYPVTNDSAEVGDNTLQDEDASMYQPVVELKTMNRFGDMDFVDSPTFDPAPPIKPPRQSTIRKDSEVPPLPARRNKSVNSVASIHDISTPVDTAYANNVITKSVESKEMLVSKSDAQPENNDRNPHQKQILKKEDSFGTDTSDVYETYDDSLRRPDADVLEESEAYEAPVKTRTFTNTSEFLSRQSSLSGLPDMALKVATSEDQFIDAPLQEAELTEHEEIATLDDLTCYDDADVLDANGASGVNKNQLYGDDEALYEDGDDADEIPLYEDCDIDDHLAGIDNPLMVNTGLPMTLEMQSEPDTIDTQEFKGEQSNSGASYTPSEDVLIKHAEGSVCDNDEADTGDSDGIGHALNDDAINGDTDDQYLRDGYGLGVSLENQTYGFKIVDESTATPSNSIVISEPKTGQSPIKLVEETLPISLPIVPPRRDIQKVTETRNNYDAVPPPRLVPGLSNDSIDAIQGDTVLRPGKSIREVSGPRDSYFFDMVEELRDSVVIGEIVPPVDTTVDDLMNDVPPGLGTPPVFGLGSDLDTTSVNGTLGFNDFGHFDGDEDVYDIPPPRQ